MTASATAALPLENITVLVEEVERLPDPLARERSRALVQAVLELHRAGLARLLELCAARDGGAALVDALAADPTVSLLLALHQLHPRELAGRVREALDELAPRLAEEGVTLELAAVGDDTVSLRVMAAGGRKVRASAASLRAAVEAAIARRAPEIASVDLAGLDAPDVAAIGVGPRR